MAEKFKNNVKEIHFPKDKFVYEASNRCGDLKAHNRLIRILKISLPSMAVIAIAMLLLWPQIMEQKEYFRLGLSRPIIAGKTDVLSVVNSKFYSTDNKNQPFMLTAKLALETKPGSRIIDLTEPKADVLLNSDLWVAISSKTGVLQQKKNMISLIGDVSVFTDAGYELHTEMVDIDLNTNNIQGNQKVNGRYIQGSITAEGIKTFNKANVIVFTGKAKLIFDPDYEENE